MKQGLDYPPVATHLDLFPSILHHLTGRSSWKDYFDGESLFAADRWPFVLTVQHNGLDVPYEFSLSDGTHQLIAHFLTPPLIHSIPGIELISLTSKDNQDISEPEALFKEVFEPAIAPLLRASLEAQSRPLKKGELAELSVCSGAAERPPFGEEESPPFKEGFFKSVIP